MLCKSHPLGIGSDRNPSDTAPIGRRVHFALSCHAPGGVAISKLASFSQRGPRLLATLVSLCALVALLTPGIASAVFTRPFLRQITGTSAGPFTGPGGVAVDSTDNLWIGDFHNVQPPFELDQFEYPSDQFVKTLEIEGIQQDPPQSLAINRSTGVFYAIGTVSNANSPVEMFSGGGTFVKSFGSFPNPAHVAVDNSPGPSAGSVYVTSTSNQSVISKFNATGEEVSFSEAGKQAYISGNQITGYEGGSFSNNNPPGAVAVDSLGDIYTTVPEYKNTRQPAVLEYGPSGTFIQAFTGHETPGLGGQHEYGGFGGELGRGVAVDTVSDHVLVTVNRYTNGAVEEGAVDEFDVTSGRFLNQIAETSVGAHLHGAFEMTVDSHGDLYVVDSGGHAVDAWGSGSFVPKLSLGEATQRTLSTAVLGGSVNPEALVDPEHTEPGFEAITDCHFQYVTEAAYNATGFTDLSSGGSPPCVPAAGSIPADEVFHPVHAEIKGLTSGVTYRYRLSATVGGTDGGAAQTAALAFTAPHAPRVLSTSAENVSSTFADLRAQIDPSGADTTYYFQYVDAAHYEPAAENPYAAGAVAPATAADIGSGGSTGSSPERVLQHIRGLQPSTAYHFRVIAVNEIGPVAGPDATFGTFAPPAPGLPDNRAYELLTPPNKGSAEDMFGTENSSRAEIVPKDKGVVSESGDQFLLTTGASFGPFPGSGSSAYVFSRNPGGWTFTSLSSPSLSVQDIFSNEILFNAADFSQLGFADAVGSSTSEAGSRRTTLLGPAGGPYTALHADAGAHLGAEPEQTNPVGASRDLSHLLLQSTSHTLCPGAANQDEGSHSLCEYSGGELKLVNVSSSGLLLSRCGAVLGTGPGSNAALGTYAGQTHNAVSADGSRVIFTAPDPSAMNRGPGCWDGATTNAPQLYLRYEGATTPISVPEAGVTDPTGRHPAEYVGASEDGSRVFFLTEGWLTSDHPQGHDPELYMYDTQTGRLTRISAGEAGSPGAKAGAELNTVPALSAQGTAVYFTAFGALASGAFPHARPVYTQGEEPVNLYRYDTTANTTTYIATVAVGDYVNNNSCGGFGGVAFGEKIPGKENALCPLANWYTTPDGRYLLFGSLRELTGYNTATSDCLIPGAEGARGRCSELFRYDSASSSLTCVSCNPSGAPPVSNALFARSALGGIASGPVRAMSDDGSRVFFDTADPLVSQDENGTLDVYEWHEGTVSLISSGHDSAPSFFLGVSPDGSNVFLGTHARLVPQDTDGAGDLYDARICTASDPCVKPPAGETAQCEGGACQRPPSAPIDATPGSLTFSGAGNLPGEISPPAPKKTVTKKAVKCKKGFTKRHGKCVAKRKSKKTKAKKAGNDRRTKR